MTAKRPPGPRDGLFGLRLVNRIKHDPLAFYTDMHREYGDAVYMRFGPYRDFTFFHPDAVREILVEKARQFGRFQHPIRVLRQWNGDGLLMTEGELWLRHRRIIQPAFHPSRFPGYVGLMADAAREHLDRLAGEVEFERVMTDLTMDVATRTFFGVDLGADRADLARVMKVLNAAAMKEFTTPFLIPRWWPGQGEKRWAIRTLDGAVRRIIRDRRASGEDRGDLLSMLLKATDEEGDGKGLTDEQVRDHVVNLFLAGHDTAAAGMTWAGWALAAHPEVAARAAAEVDGVPAGPDPTFADLPNLKYVERVVKEVLRHRTPTIGVFGRQALQDVEVGGWPVPKGGIARVFSWVTQHDPRWFPDPEKFDPDRFAPGRAEAIPPGAYFPFGLGPRGCIGNAFALTEMVLLTAMLLRRFTFAFAPGQGDPAPVAGMSLRPAGGLRLVLRRR
jgi:cytochrome P450